MTSNGASVIFISENHSRHRKNLTVHKKSERVKTAYEEYFIDKLTKHKFDVVFIIKGTQLTQKCLSAIKHYKHAIKILYQFDSIERYPWIKDLLPYFDFNFTFDNTDSLKYNMLFRPLFFAEDIINIKREKHRGSKYLLSSICSYYPQRISILKKLKHEYKEQAYFYVYMSKSNLVKNIFDLQISDFKLLRLKSKDRAYMLQNMQNSISIVDIEFEGQNGLTIRTLETIGMQKKLITTNNNIKFYNFYDPSYIFILQKDLSNLMELREFLDSPTDSIPKSILKMYSLQEWCKDIFTNNPSHFLITSINVVNG